MRSERSHRKPDKPSFNGSLKDGLYDQLLHSLTGDDLAAESEVRAYYQSKGQAKWSLYEVDPLAPWPIQRRQAYTAATLFTPDEYLRCIHGLWECEGIDLSENRKVNTSPPPNEQAILADWAEWRERMNRHYCLSLPPADPL
jgi:hypothetical protein